MAYIHGNDSGNLLAGTSGDDVIIGNGGNDTIQGGGGNDRIYGGGGTDSVFGGAGDDIIVFRSGLDADALETIDGGAGFDTLRLSSYGSAPGSGAIHINFQFAFLSSIERLQFASWWNDINVSFEIHPDAPTSFSPALEFAGSAGVDNVGFFLHQRASLDLSGATFTNWRAGDHVTIHVWGTECTVDGTGQADDIWIEGSFGLIRGNGGDDEFHFSLGGAVLTTIDGGAGNDSIVLDTTGYLFDTRISRVEEIVFAKDSTFISADFFSDAFDVGAANPFFHFVDMDAQVSAVRVLMSRDNYFSAAGFTFENWGSANFVGVGGTPNDDTIVGSVVKDELYGEDGNDLLRGGQGNDLLYGGAGDDRVNGGDGDDRLIIGSGSDVLIGGAGNDTFAVFSSVDDSGIITDGRDRILDFSVGDKIDLSYLDANAALTGDQAFVLDTDGILVEGEIQLIGNLNTVIRINLDADPEADMEIALWGVPPGSLSAGDFIL